MATNLLPILLIVGGAAVVMKKKKKKKKGKRCPAQVALVEVTESEAKTMAKEAWKVTSGDPLQAADILFTKLVPEGCTKNDYKTKATSKWFTEFGPDVGPDEWNLSMVYAGLVSAMMDANIDWDNESEVAKGRALMQQISTWYFQLTGELLPDID